MRIFTLQVKDISEIFDKNSKKFLQIVKEELFKLLIKKMFPKFFSQLTLNRIKRLHQTNKNLFHLKKILFRYFHQHVMKKIVLLSIPTIFLYLFIFLSVFLFYRTISFCFSIFLSVFPSFILPSYFISFSLFVYITFCRSLFFLLFHSVSPSISTHERFQS